jgi:hypothetical protein
LPPRTEQTFVGARDRVEEGPDSNAPTETDYCRNSFGISPIHDEEAALKIVNKTFWRLAPASGIDPAAVCESHIVTSPDKFIAKVRRLDGVVLATWDDDRGHGRVHALGIVRDVKDCSAFIDWRRADFTLHPSGQGASQWRAKSAFEFAPQVAERYGLMNRFHDAFANTADSRTPTQPTEVTRNSVVEQTVPDRAHAPSAMRATHRTESPKCNRVAPNGQIIATPDRGTFMGNRTSPPRWLVCDLHFRRELKEPRKYTKLFFLDEAVALAAGHRPCSTCRRERYQAYLAAVTAELSISGAAELDHALNVARTAGHRKLPIAALPNGAFITVGEGDYRLKWLGSLHRWTPAGYVDSSTAADVRIDEAVVLTPEPSLAALRNGYAPDVHGSLTTLDGRP